MALIETPAASPITFGKFEMFLVRVACAHGIAIAIPIQNLQSVPLFPAKDKPGAGKGISLQTVPPPGRRVYQNSSACRSAPGQINPGGREVQHVAPRWQTEGGPQKEPARVDTSQAGKQTTCPEGQRTSTDTETAGIIVNETNFGWAKGVFADA